MENLPAEGSTRIGTAGGLLTILLVHLNGDELIRTAILGGVGAAVSFIVSIAMKWLVKTIKARF
jgi:hypothetical protein